MHFSGSVKNENLLYRTDSLRFFGDHSTVTVGPDVRDSEPTPLLLNEEISDWEKAPNIMPSTISVYWIRKTEYPTLGKPTVSRRTLDGVCSGTVWVFAIEYLSKHIPDEFSQFPATLFDAL